MSQTDWEDERAADIHDRDLRHGEMHRECRGVWLGKWFFPFGVERDGQDSERAVDTGDRAGVA